MAPISEWSWTNQTSKPKSKFVLRSESLHLSDRDKRNENERAERWTRLLCYSIYYMIFLYLVQRLHGPSRCPPCRTALFYVSLKVLCLKRMAVALKFYSVSLYPFLWHRLAIPDVDRTNSRSNFSVLLISLAVRPSGLAHQLSLIKTADIIALLNSITSKWSSL